MNDQALVASADRLLKVGEVLAISGVRKTKLYALIKRGQFPQPVKIDGASRWREGEVCRWRDGLPQGTAPPPVGRERKRRRAAR